jgi:hypothetical protein
MIVVADSSSPEVVEDGEMRVRRSSLYCTRDSKHPAVKKENKFLKKGDTERKGVKTHIYYQALRPEGLR